MEEGTSDFDQCNLSHILVDKLRQNGISKLFPIQKLVVPEILRHAVGPVIFPPRDICVSAPTGSGKTLCYVLPVVDSLRQRRLRRIRALIVVPVVNLANQVADVFRLYAQNTNLKIVLVTGKRNFDKECEELYEKVPILRSEDDCGSLEIEVATADIVIATPGRLLEHLRLCSEKFCLKLLRFLILDEADRLMSEFRSDWLGEIENAVYELKSKDFPHVERHRINIDSVQQLLSAGRMPLQKILLSATLFHNPEQLKQLNLFQPHNFTTDGLADTLDFKANQETNFGIPVELEENYVKIKLKYKPLGVYCIIKMFDYAKVLCFVDKIESSRKLAHVLVSLGVKDVHGFSSVINKYRMQRLFTRFNKNSAGVLICTDVMSRGIDIDKVDCVINYDRPKCLKTYVHRVGRTARAGEKGIAFTLVEKSELNDLKELFANRTTNLKETVVEEEKFKQYEDIYMQALAEVKAKLETEQQAKTKLMKVRRGRRNESQKR